MAAQLPETAGVGLDFECRVQVADGGSRILLLQRRQSFLFRLVGRGILAQLRGGAPIGLGIAHPALAQAARRGAVGLDARR